MQIKSDLKLVTKTSDKLLGELSALNLDDSILFEIKLALEEALINAIIHGNKRNEDLPVSIGLSVKDGSIEITVEDTGCGFDYRKIPNPILDENMMKMGGRGVFLIKRLMDKVNYNDPGNRITMVKHISNKK